MIRKSQLKEPWTVSFWTTVIRSLIWMENDDSIEYADFIFDPNGYAQTVINMGIKLENNNFDTGTLNNQTKQFSKEVILGIETLLCSM